MTFSELKVGDHFIWPVGGENQRPNSVNVNIKIATADDGCGFAVDLATRQDCVSPSGPVPCELPQLIAGNEPVIKLNGTL